MQGDVVVVGMVQGAHTIEDIGYIVPNQAVVRIPAELAVRSRDLWAGISQRRLFQLQSGNNHPTSLPNVEGMQSEIARLGEQLAKRDARIKDLEQEIQTLKAQKLESEAQTHKLDSILGLLKDRPAVITSPSFHAAAVAKPVDDEVNGDAPAFIPGTIRPDVGETQLTVKDGEVTESSVTAAAGKLRQFRQGK